jgi:hypothetical protein
MELCKTGVMSDMMSGSESAGDVSCGVKSRHAGRDHGTSATDLTADVLGCQFVNSCRRFYVSQLAHLLEFWLNSTEWSDERHSGGGF